MPVEKLTIKEQQIINGPKGISFKYYHKDGDDIVKIQGLEQPDGKFILITKKNKEPAEKKELTKKELLKYIKDNDQLVFAIESIEALKGGKRKSRRGTRKGSRKTSRKGSRKGSKKASRKGSKGGARGGSRKGSRKVKKY